jgi:hypothetical protein
MALLTQYASFFISPFGEKSVTDELNAFLRSHRIINIEKRLIDGERGTGWVFLVEYGSGANGEGGGKNAPNASSQRIDYRIIFFGQHPNKQYFFPKYFCNRMNETVFPIIVYISNILISHKYSPSYKMSYLFIP